MSKARHFSALAIGLAWASGCSDPGIMENTSAASAAPAAVLGVQANSAPSADVGGDWLTTIELALTFPDWVAVGVFGIQPEGPITSARCAGPGIMTLAQNGDAFSGTAMITGGGCVTRGGQTFVGLVTPEAIVDGRIAGQSLTWQQLVAGGLVECSMHAVIAEAEAGTATVLDGGGPCVVPGHPSLADPLDPPPGGTQTMLSWMAVRP